MSELLVKAHLPDKNGNILRITPESAGWKYVGLCVYRFKSGDIFKSREENRETCLVVVSGRVDIIVGEHEFMNVGDRNSPFENKKPFAVYASANLTYIIVAHSNAEVAVCSAPGSGKFAPRLISPKDIGFEERGHGANRRLVNNILPEESPAESLLVVEVITPNGNWSSYPPHKHDTGNDPEETRLEETYFYHISPEQGFAFQRVYTDDHELDETITVHDNDVVIVPKGYHPVGAPYGYDVYYLNVMAGPIRKWLFQNDPNHDWILRREVQHERNY